MISLDRTKVFAGIRILLKEAECHFSFVNCDAIVHTQLSVYACMMILLCYAMRHHL